MSIDTTKDLEEIKKEYANRSDKPWGYEKVLISTENYLTKEIYIKEGYTTSYHYHKEKEESIYMSKALATFSLSTKRSSSEETIQWIFRGGLCTRSWPQKTPLCTVSQHHLATISCEWKITILPAN